MAVDNKTHSQEEALSDKYKDRVTAEKNTQITLKRMQKDFVTSINSYAVVLILLTAVTFAGFLQPPGGFRRLNSRSADEFAAIPPQSAAQNTSLSAPRYMSRRPEITIFIFFNSLSFFFSVSDLLLCVLSSLSPLRSIGRSPGGEDWIPPAYGEHLPLQSEQATTKLLAHYVSSTLVKLIFVNALFAISLTCCVVAFGAAGLGVVPSDVSNANLLAVTCTLVVGIILFSVFLVWLLIYTFRFMERAVSNESLSVSLQIRAGSPQVQFRYLNRLKKHDESEKNLEI